MRKSLLMITAACLLGFATAAAHDADPIDIDLELGQDYYFEHEDEYEWKGTATVTVTNTGTEAWGNFHFRIFDPTGQGNYQDVIFTTGDGTYPRLNGATMPPYDPLVGYGYTIVTTVDGYSQINLEFHNAQVDPGQSVEFIVYTDNTAGQHSFFGMMLWPSPVTVSTEHQSLSGIKALFR